MRSSSKSIYSAVIQKVCLHGMPIFFCLPSIYIYKERERERERIHETEAILILLLTRIIQQTCFFFAEKDTHFLLSLLVQRERERERAILDPEYSDIYSLDKYNTTKPFILQRRRKQGIALHALHLLRFLGLVAVNAVGPSKALVLILPGQRIAPKP